jgi:hypothetical protein
MLALIGRGYRWLRRVTQMLWLPAWKILGSSVHRAPRGHSPPLKERLFDEALPVWVDTSITPTARHLWPGVELKCPDRWRARSNRERGPCIPRR